MKLTLELTDGERTEVRKINFRSLHEVNLTIMEMEDSLRWSYIRKPTVSLTQVGTVHGELPGEGCCKDFTVVTRKEMPQPPPGYDWAEDGKTLIPWKNCE